MKRVVHAHAENANVDDTDERRRSDLVSRDVVHAHAENANVNETDERRRSDLVNAFVGEGSRPLDAAASKRRKHHDEYLAIAKYLTAKGSSIDPGVKWRSQSLPDTKLQDGQSSLPEWMIGSEKYHSVGESSPPPHSAHHDDLQLPPSVLRGCPPRSLADEEAQPKRREENPTEAGHSPATRVQWAEEVSLTNASGAPPRSGLVGLPLFAPNCPPHPTQAERDPAESFPHRPFRRADSFSGGLASLGMMMSHSLPNSLHRTMQSIQGELDSLARGDPSSAPGSVKLATQVAKLVTVLFVDIKGLTGGGSVDSCTGRVGEWVTEFYEIVDHAVASYGVRRMESRGDCCICVCGDVGSGFPPLADVDSQFPTDPADPAGPASPTGPAVPAGQVSRMLAFCADLHDGLARLVGPGSPHRTTRMGMATGDVAVLGAAPGAHETDPWRSR